MESSNWEFSQKIIFNNLLPQATTFFTIIVLMINKIQLVVYYQCCVQIG